MIRFLNIRVPATCGAPTLQSNGPHLAMPSLTIAQHDAMMASLLDERNENIGRQRGSRAEFRGCSPDNGSERTAWKAARRSAFLDKAAVRLGPPIPMESPHPPDGLLEGDAPEERRLGVQPQRQPVLRVEAARVQDGVALGGVTAGEAANANPAAAIPLPLPPPWGGGICDVRSRVRSRVQCFTLLLQNTFETLRTFEKNAMGKRKLFRNHCAGYTWMRSCSNASGKANPIQKREIFWLGVVRLSTTWSTTCSTGHTAESKWPVCGLAGAHLEEGDALNAQLPLVPGARQLREVHDDLWPSTHG